MSASANASLSRLFDTHGPRTRRIAQCGQFDETLEIIKQRRIASILSLKTAALTASAAPREWRRIKVFALDGAAPQA